MPVIVKPPKKVLFSFSVSVGKNRGSIDLTDDHVVINAGTPRTIKKSYVAAVLKKADCALSKVEASFEYYDIFGNKEQIELILNAQDFLALKKILRK